MQRTHIQLMNKYNILKRDSRKEYSNLRSEANMTGGGEYKPITISDRSVRINNLSSLSICGDSNNADCDAIESK